MPYKNIALLIILSGVLAGCAHRPPEDPDNICSIFREHKGWYKEAVKMQQQWGTPIHVAMAFIKQESAFVHDAKPARNKVLGFIPGRRPSTAYGYAQVLDTSWQDYQNRTGNGGSRTDFGDAISFIGWYIHQTQSELKISKWDPYNQYLAYHEGRGGYSRGTYRNKAWLQQVAKKVETQAITYGAQLRRCKAQLDKKRGWFR